MLSAEQLALSLVATIFCVALAALLLVPLGAQKRAGLTDAAPLAEQTAGEDAKNDAVQQKDEDPEQEDVEPVEPAASAPAATQPAQPAAPAEEQAEVAAEVTRGANDGLHPGAFVGKQVILVELKSKAILNGCVGRALSFDPETRRVAVELLSPPAGEDARVKVKPGNLLLDSHRQHDIDGLDEKQPRDWLFREGIDPPASWSTLWQLRKVDPSSPARQPSQCQCSGDTIHFALDAVTCWRCKRVLLYRSFTGALCQFLCMYTKPLAAPGLCSSPQAASKRVSKSQVMSMGAGADAGG